MTPSQAADAMVDLVLGGEPEDAARASKLEAAYRRREDRLLGQLDLDDETVARLLSAYRARLGY